MIIETTTPFTNPEDADDSLAGLKELPGFILGYVSSTHKKPSHIPRVTLFECTSVTDSLPKQQRRIIEFRSNPTKVLALRPLLLSEMR
jgi:hypothetical protein